VREAAESFESIGYDGPYLIRAKELVARMRHQRWMNKMIARADPQLSKYELLRSCSKQARKQEATALEFQRQHAAKARVCELGVRAGEKASGTSGRMPRFSGPTITAMRRA
jgi:hypothetical protein